MNSTNHGLIVPGLRAVLLLTGSALSLLQGLLLRVVLIPTHRRLASVEICICLHTSLRPLIKQDLLVDKVIVGAVVAVPWLDGEDAVHIGADEALHLKLGLLLAHDGAYLLEAVAGAEEVVAVLVDHEGHAEGRLFHALELLRLRLDE